MDNIKELNDNHWILEDYKQRVTTKEWKEMLLNDRDHMIFCGHLRRIVGKKLGAGVVEISKAPLENDNG